MYPSTTVSYDLAQARIADLRHQARRASVARAAQAEPQPGKPLVTAGLDFGPPGGTGSPRKADDIPNY